MRSYTSIRPVNGLISGPSSALHPQGRCPALMTYYQPLTDGATIKLSEGISVVASSSIALVSCISCYVSRVWSVACRVRALAIARVVAAIAIVLF